MSWWHRSLATGAAVLLAACAAGPETQRLQRESSPVELTDVPFFAQQDYQCGPAALATVLHAAGRSVAPLQLVDEVFVPARRGSLQAELIAAVRRRGLVPYVLDRHIDSALAELHAGRPVLILQNLATAQSPAWHYAVLVGYDPRSEQFILRSGADARLQMPMRRLLQTWDRGGRWMLVVTRADEVPASASANAWLRAAAPFESLGQLELATRAYETAVRRWPDAALAWAALGNIRARRGDARAAAEAFRRSLALDAGLHLVRNNYAWTLASAGCRADAIDELRAGLRDAAAMERDVLEKTLREIETAPQADDGTCPL